MDTSIVSVCFGYLRSRHVHGLVRSCSCYCHLDVVHQHLLLLCSHEIWSIRRANGKVLLAINLSIHIIFLSCAGFFDETHNEVSQCIVGM
jgi:hypothetical protein